MRAVYNLANRSSFLVLTSSLLRTLFLNLKSDALVFLAGIWAREPPMSADNSSLHEIALRHAAAFLEAHVLEDDGVDFQTIVPALLIALQSAIGGARKAAVECLNRIRLISEKRLKNVYKFDMVYGDAKGAYIKTIMTMDTHYVIDTLQYLEQGDLKHYLGYLVANQHHVIHDPTYLRVAHAEHLNLVQSDRKKDAR